MGQMLVAEAGAQSMVRTRPGVPRQFGLLRYLGATYPCLGGIENTSFQHVLTSEQ
jgi:hypothetical protein